MIKNGEQRGSVRHNLLHSARTCGVRQSIRPPETYPTSDACAPTAAPVKYWASRFLSSLRNLRVLCASALSSLASSPFSTFNFLTPRPAQLPHSNAFRTHCGETLEPAEICHVHGEYVVDSMHVHCRRQTRVVHLHSRDAVLHDNSLPFPVNGLAVRQ